MRLENGLVALLIEDHLGQSRAKKKSRNTLLTSTSSHEDCDSLDSLESKEEDSIGSSDSDGGGRGYDTGESLGSEEVRGTKHHSALDMNDLSVSVYITSWVVHTTML